MFVFGEMPEEVKAEMKSRLEHMQMEGEEMTTRFTGFIESLDEDGLVIVRNLIRQADRDSDFANFVNGWISNTLHSKHGVCMYCNSKHETAEDVIATHAAAPGDFDD